MNPADTASIPPNTPVEAPTTVQCKQCLAITNEGNGCSAEECPAGVLAVGSYRLLERGEVIKRGDESLADDTVTWLPVEGWTVGTKWDGGAYVPVRRRNAGVAIPPVPDDVWEALQRMIENAASLGPACQEDALLIARWRGQFVAARERAASGVMGTQGGQSNG
jgi:hypothetical protein